MKKFLSLLICLVSLLVEAKASEKKHDQKTNLSEGVTEITSLEKLEGFLAQKGKKTYIDVYMTNCPPCKVLAPDFANWAKKNQKSAYFAKIDSKKVKGIAKKYTIQGAPTVLVFDEQGKLVSRKIGLYEIRDFMSDNP